MRRIKARNQPHKALTLQQAMMFAVWEEYIARTSSPEEAHGFSVIIGAFREGSKTKIAPVAMVKPYNDPDKDPEIKGLSLGIGLSDDGKWSGDFSWDELWSFDGSERRQEAACEVMALGMAPLLPLRDNAWPNWYAMLQNKLNAKPHHIEKIKSKCELFSKMFFNVFNEATKATLTI